MPDCSPSVSQQFAEMNGLNSKLGLDEQYDNRREVLARQRAYEDLNLRRAQNAATVDHFLNILAVTATQTGDTSNQQTTSPVRTGAGDALAAQSVPANRAVDAAIAGVAAAVTESVQTNVTTQVSALGEQILALGGTITTGFQALGNSITAQAEAIAALGAALTALKPTGTA